MSIENQRPALLNTTKQGSREADKTRTELQKLCQVHRFRRLQNTLLKMVTVRSPPVESVVVFGGQGQQAV